MASASFNTPAITNARFCKESKRLTVLTSQGVRMYDLTDWKKEASFIRLDEDATIVEHIGNRLAVVLYSNQDTVHICDVVDGQLRDEGPLVRFMSPVLDVKGMTEPSEHLCVCLRNRISIRGIRLNEVVSIDTREQDLLRPIMAISHSRGLVAYPDKSGTGNVGLKSIRPENNKMDNTIGAHESPITALAFNSDGSILATASMTGTLIRTFNMIGNRHELLQVFRPSLGSADLQSLAFSECDRFLSQASRKGTVDVLEIKRQESPGVMRIALSYVTALANQEGAYASACVPDDMGSKKICAIVSLEGELRKVFVVTWDGKLCVYDLPNQRPESSWSLFPAVAQCRPVYFKRMDIGNPDDNDDDDPSRESHGTAPAHPPPPPSSSGSYRSLLTPSSPRSHPTHHS